MTVECPELEIVIQMMATVSSLLSLALLLSCSLSVLARQEWEEEPGYREVNPQGDVVMVCRVRNKKGECRWERDNTPIAAYKGKYEWAGDTKTGDCSLRILNANYDYDNGGWVCQVTASSFRERDTLISHPANLVVRGEHLDFYCSEEPWCVIVANFDISLILQVIKLDWKKVQCCLLVNILKIRAYSMLL